jgi:predicted amidohydrolase YtcJ
LKLAGITRDTQPVPGGEIGKDKAGESNGILHEAQQDSIRRLLPPIGYDIKCNNLEKALQMLVSSGLTGALTTQDYPGEPKLGNPPLEAYFDLYAGNKIPLRLNLALRPKLESLISDTRELMRQYTRLNGKTYSGFGGALIKLNPIGEVSFDMQVGEKNSTMSLEELQGILLLVHQHHLRLQTHQSSDFNLEGFNRVSKAVQLPGRRWIALHCNGPGKESLDLLERLDMMVVTQPSRIFYATKDQLQVPLREFSKRGIPYCLGSDWPSEGRRSHNPFQVIYAATARKDRHGQVHFPEQAISPEAALRGYTLNNARLTFEETDKGSIEPGKLADLVVISDDILSVSQEKIKDIVVLKTLLGGKVVYES